MARRGLGAIFLENGPQRGITHREAMNTVMMGKLVSNWVELVELGQIGGLDGGADTRQSTRRRSSPTESERGPEDRAGVK